MRSLTREDLAALPSYQPGRRPDEAAPHASAGVAKLSSNEIAFGPLPGVREAVVAAMSEVNRYPDFFGRDLVAAVAAHAGVDESQVVLENGSSPLCIHAVEAVAQSGDEVVMPWRSFEVYPRAALLRQSRPVRVPLRDGLFHDLDAMLDAVGPRTRAVFVCTPNNPTGPAVSQADVDSFVSRVPADVLVIVDEAYREFAGPPGRRPDSVPLVQEHPNVVVLRTFSKAYGLAGLRLGYAVASAEVAVLLRKLVAPFAVSSLTQAAAMAALQATAEMERRVGEVIEERSRLIDALRGAGLAAPDSDANFVWLPFGEAAQAFAGHCEDHGVLVRAYPPDGVRVTVGLPAENDRFVAAAQKWLSAGGEALPAEGLGEAAAR